MAESNYDKTQTFTAGADLTDSYNCFVASAAGGKVALPSANGLAIGVHVGPGIDGAATGVMCASGEKIAVLSGAAFSDNALLATDAAGKAVTATGVTTQTLGVALGAATAADQLITILFQPTGFVAQA